MMRMTMMNCQFRAEGVVIFLNKVKLRMEGAEEVPLDSLSGTQDGVTAPWEWMDMMVLRGKMMRVMERQLGGSRPRFPMTD
jgi:hypothetical protein